MPPKREGYRYASRICGPYRHPVLQGEGALPTKSAMPRSKDAPVLAGWADGRMAARRNPPLESILQGEGALPTKSVMPRSKDAPVLAGWADGKLAARRNPPQGAAETFAARFA